MLFFFKTKPIEITAFVPSNYAFAYKHTPIRPARENFPKWWKNIESSSFDWDLFKRKTTVKSCSGIINILTTGFIMPLWSDLALEWDKDNWKYMYSDGQSHLGIHDNNQMPEFYEDHLILKISSPWFIKSPVSLLFNHPFYLHQTPFPFTTPYGIESASINKHNSSLNSTNVLLFAKKTLETKREIIKVNTPLLHIIPLTDKPVNIKCEVVSIEEYNKQISASLGITSFASKGIRQKSLLNNLK
jgi:hypothetical protein